mgnify:CR=1 FL=1
MKCSVFKVVFSILIFSAVSYLYSDTIHEVQKGETLYSISKKYGVSVADVQSANGLSDNGIKVGQKIKVPTASGSTAVASAKSNTTSVSATKTTTAKVPDLAKNDPHTYSSKKADSSLVWPVKTDSIVYINGKVGGVSMAAKKDEEVKAIRAGTVMFSGSYRGFGNVVFIQSKTGHIYAYTGLGTVKVNKGDYCVFGAQIGTAGVDSYTAKPQMSLMVFQNGLPIDPAKAPRG